jgi:hypothetical protein
MYISMAAMPRPWSWNTPKSTKPDYVLVKEYKKMRVSSQLGGGIMMIRSGPNNE